MDKRTSLVLALVITGVFPVITLNALQNRPEEYTEQGAIDAALYYLKNSPIFKYDGMLDSINVTGAYRARTPTPTWLVAISFDCRHSGYGDRDGQMLLQVISPHVMGVIVEEGEVIEAAIDGRWDVTRLRHIEWPASQSARGWAFAKCGIVVQPSREVYLGDRPAGFTVRRNTPIFDEHGQPGPFYEGVRFVTVKNVEYTAVVVGLWLPTAIFAAYPSIAFIRGPVRRWRRRRKGWCVKCGYDLIENVSGVCPECGEPICDDAPGQGGC